MPTDLQLSAFPCAAEDRAKATDPPTFRVLGVRVDAVQIPQAIARVERWIAERVPNRYVAVTGMHGISESTSNPDFRTILDAADMVVADGMPLVWLGRWHGFRNMRRRVYGPEFTETFCQVTGSKYRHFFYGGAPGVADHFADVLHRRHGVRIAGTYCPPFRPLTPEEDADVICRINSSNADLVWVGLSTPKQEAWMYGHRNQLAVPAMVGVGAAFDLNTGRLAQAPHWMREHGLEWLFRLLAEPKRLWRRYLLNGPRFVGNVFLEILHLRNFD
jgi:N-acetylglucosaminyldiphosphoundecaprenol N-acetyl-beta-D-mannosaminyltransferase